MVSIKNRMLQNGIGTQRKRLRPQLTIYFHNIHLQSVGDGSKNRNNLRQILQRRRFIHRNPNLPLDQEIEVDFFGFSNHPNFLQ